MHRTNEEEFDVDDNIIIDTSGYILDYQEKVCEKFIYDINSI
jgi:hypothetical protein